MPAAGSTPHRFNRFEITYVAELSQAAALRDDLRSRLEVDTQGAPDRTVLQTLRERIGGRRVTVLTGYDRMDLQGGITG